jgi:hypothetical protein
MKRLFFAVLLIAGTLAATTSNAQAFRGRIGYGFAHRGYIAPRAFLPVPVPAPYYYGGGAVIAPPVYGYGYRHYDPYFYHGRRFGYRRRW